MAKKLPRKKSGAGAANKPASRLSAGGYTLANSDFNTELRPASKSLSVVYGNPGEGKTTLATRFMPDPVALISLDGRGRHCIEDARERGRVIYPVEINYPSDLSSIDSNTAKAMARESMNRVMHHLHVAVEEAKRGNIRSIAIDTGTELTDIDNIAITGNVDKVTDDYGRSKGLVNRHWWSIFRLVRESEANFMVIARGKKVWSGGAPTGILEPRGVDAATEAADWVGWIRRGRRGFEVKIVKSGVQGDETGEVYRESDWGAVGPYAYICGLQYPKSDVEDWV